MYINTSPANLFLILLLHKFTVFEFTLHQNVLNSDTELETLNFIT